MAENKNAAQAGGSIARQARHQLESQTGKSVVTSANYLPPPGPEAPKLSRVPKAVKAAKPTQVYKAPKKAQGAANLTLCLPPGAARGG